jgi:hypothetical protein
MFYGDDMVIRFCHFDIEKNMVAMSYSFTPKSREEMTINEFESKYPVRNICFADKEKFFDGFALPF